MTTAKFLEYMNSGRQVTAESGAHKTMHRLSQEAIRITMEITCKIFAERLYEMMGWDPVYRYRLQGVKIRYNNEQMYLFDLNAHECFLPQKKDAATGKVKAAAAEFPQDWQSSFGMKVAEHDMSTQVNFLDGYISPNDTEQTEGSDE